MAFTLTNQGSNNGYGSSLTIASFTPTANSLLILTSYRRNNTAPNAPTGHGTWTLVDSISGNNRQVYTYALLIGASPSADTVSVSWANSSTGTITVTQVQGSDLTNIATAIPQSNALSFYNGGGGLHVNTLPLAAFGSTTNLTMVMCQDSGTTTPEAGYSIDFDGEVNVYFLAAEDTTPSFNTTQNFTNVKGISLEVQEAGGGSIDVTSTLGLIDYTSNSATVSLTGVVDINSTLGLISYSNNNASIQLSGVVDVSPTLGLITYSSNDANVSLSGAVDVTSTLGLISYESNNAIIQISGDIQVNPTLGLIDYQSNDALVVLESGIIIESTLGLINYESIDASVELQGIIDVNSTLGLINYESYNALVTIGGGQSIGNVTVGFKGNNYSVSFKPDIITSSFKPDTLNVNFK